MGYRSLTDKTVKIRKSHSCHACQTKYDPPTEMRYTAGVNDGEMTSAHWCEICDSYMTPERWKDYDYEMGEGDIWEDRDYEIFRNNYLSAKT